MKIVWTGSELIRYLGYILDRERRPVTKSSGFFLICTVHAINARTSSSIAIVNKAFDSLSVYL
ncbi:hypothetical protein TcasGA2_TC006974 [Tribolium castaneum]|uniref:Uncharacterized protein n=1 Tax=Tribolium castaneum TaxID=7070 RepID=D7GY10_TRICA|nr:hypothetical protein TcasGA2_TC006974 [Tribolium castaneum]